MNSNFIFYVLRTYLLVTSSILLCVYPTGQEACPKSRSEYYRPCQTWTQVLGCSVGCLPAPAHDH